MSRIPLKYHTNVLFYTKYTHPKLICRGTDARMDGRMDGRMDRQTDGRTKNIYSIFRDKLLLLGEHVLLKINKDGGFRTEVMGQHGCVKLWIHFNISGHNNLVGHMNQGRPKFIYQDCRCLFDDLSSPIQICSLITSEELKHAHLTEDV